MSYGSGQDESPAIPVFTRDLGASTLAVAAGQRPRHQGTVHTIPTQKAGAAIRTALPNP